MMTERVMNMAAVPSYLVTALRSDRVKVSEANRVITIAPVEDGEDAKSRCPLLGIAKDCDLTVEKFLEWKREEREREYEQELRS